MIQLVSKQGCALAIFLVIAITSVLSCNDKRQTIIYSSKELDDRQVYLYDLESDSKQKITNHTKNDGYPSVSPDQKRIAFYGKYDERKTWSIHTANIDGSGIKRLTFAKNKWDSSPSWSPDAKQIVFGREYQDADENWQEELWIMNSDGSKQRKINGLKGGGPYFMNDGKILYHSGFNNGEICIALKDGSNIITLTNNSAEDIFPEISPDGKQIAFMSDRDGNREIYVMDIDGSNQKRLTHNKVDDWNPSWSADGETIIFSSENTTGYMDIYQINKDGSSQRKIIENGIQAKWLK